MLKWKKKGERERERTLLSVDAGSYVRDVASRIILELLWITTAESASALSNIESRSVSDGNAIRPD